MSQKDGKEKRYLVRMCINRDQHINLEFVADCYTINLGTLISGNILLSSLVYAMPPEREKVSVGWSETVY